jgi:hypothetical protein
MGRLQGIAADAFLPVWSARRAPRDAFLPAVADTIWGIVLRPRCWQEAVKKRIEAWDGSLGSGGSFHGFPNLKVELDLALALQRLDSLDPLFV